MTAVIKFFLFSAIVLFFFVFSSPLRVVQTPRQAISRAMGDDYYRDGAYADAYRAYRLFLADSMVCLDDDAVRMKAGISAFHAEDCSLAAFLLDENAIRDENLRDYCLFFRANALHGLGRHTEALDALRRVGKNDLSRAVERDAMELRVEILQVLERFRDANGLLTSLIASARTPLMRAEYYLEMARNYYSTGDSGNAYRIVQKLAESYERTYPALEAMQLFIENRSKQGEEMTFQVLDWALDLLLIHRRGYDALRLLNARSFSGVNEAQSAALLHHRGRAHFYSGEYSTAEKIFLELYTLPAGNDYRGPSLLFLARIALARGDAAKASSCYRDYIREYPSSAMTGEIRWKLGWVAEGRRDFSAALEQYHALEKSVSAYRERGMMRLGFCYYEMGDYGKAAYAFNKLARSGREESMKEGGLYWKAVSLEKLGDSSNAALIFREVTKRYPLHYYGFRAREKLGMKAGSPLGGFLSFDSLLANVNPLPADSRLNDILKVGEIAGREYGTDAIEHFKRSDAGRRYGLPVYWSAYHRIGAFNEAMKTGIIMRQEAKSAGGSDADPDILWRVYPPFYSTLVRRHARENNLPPGLVYALMRRESAFEPDVVSAAGAIGLMQLLPSMGKSIGEELGFEGITRSHLAQAAWNVRLGTKHLRDLIDSFGGIVPAAIASYNAGDGAVRRWISVFGAEDIEKFIEAIEYTETRNYVKRVLGDFWIYQSLYNL